MDNHAAKLTPEDNLWVTILLHDQELNLMTLDAAKSLLYESGFPDHIISEYIKIISNRDNKDGQTTTT